MQLLSLAKITAGAAVVATVLAACTVVVEEGPGYRPPPPRPDRPAMCTREYAPVCGQRGNDRRTFGNACMARVDGYRVVSGGECRRGGGSGWGSGGGGRPPARACTREYAPVCARRDGVVRTFGNACEAEAARHRIIRRGAC